MFDERHKEGAPLTECSLFAVAIVSPAVRRPCSTQTDALHSYFLAHDGGRQTAGVAQGSGAFERGGGSATVANQQQQQAATAASEGVLGVVAPVAAEVAGSTGPGTVNGKDKDSLEWSEVGTECQKRVYICTNRQGEGGRGR